MSWDPKQIGLSVWTKGKPHNPQTLTKFLEQVTEAAQKPKRTRTPPDHKWSSCDASHLWGNPIPDDKRCNFVHQKGDKKGKRCGRWAMKGAKRCPCHGGYRQNPSHPATIRRLDDIVQAVAEADAAKELRKLPNQKDLETIRNTIRDIGAAFSPSIALEGVKAYQLDDAGKAFRRWRENTIKHAPKLAQRARKKTLKSRR